ncbi:hypothetical protein ALC57_15532 [Trachymyrmex cornetzi]|uniref:Uncharacterized protein n=1 Tax=Trachymyrmex cornetzi TaxID=471704 RepID=A0A151IWV4_9HYME|nr:hypothetical protein ALC57_15532 [Trachymyrmex cornetzi]
MGNGRLIPATDTKIKPALPAREEDKGRDGLTEKPPAAEFILCRQSARKAHSQRSNEVNQSHVHILQGIKWNPACQGGILVAVDAARGLSRGISEWEKSESPFRQRSFLPKEFSKKSSQPDSDKGKSSREEGKGETWDRNEVERGECKKHRGYGAETISEIPIDRRIERTERKTYVYDE